MSADTEERDDDGSPALAGHLRDLLQSPGWAWLMREVDHAYGPAAYGRRLNQVLSEIPAGPDFPYELARVTQQIHAEAAAVNNIMGQPKALLARLTTKPSARPFESFRRTLGSHR